jgi:hypothetical protein
MTTPPLLKSAALGIATSIVALVVSFFASTDGVRINTEAWPPAAKAVLFERSQGPRSGEPLSEEQWKRIDKALREHGGEAMFSHTAAAELRRVWPIAVVIALLALVLARWLWKAITPAASVTFPRKTHTGQN